MGSKDCEILRVNLLDQDKLSTVVKGVTLMV